MFITDIKTDTIVQIGVYSNKTAKFNYYNANVGSSPGKDKITTSITNKDDFIAMNLVEGLKFKLEVVTPVGVAQWNAKVTEVREVANVYFVTFKTPDASTPQDRRKAQRLPFVTDIMYYVRGDARYVASRNISKTGLGFATMHLHNVGDTLTMTVAIGEKTGICTGKVVRTEELSKGVYMVGVCFTKDIPSDLKDVIATLNQKAIDEYKDNTWI